MDTEALIYSGEGRLQTSDSQPCILCPMSAVKLLYKDCQQDDNRELVTLVSLRFVICVKYISQLLNVDWFFTDNVPFLSPN